MTENTITITEVWEQIKELQEQIASLKETTDCIIAVNDIDEYDNGAPSKTFKRIIITKYS